MEHFISKFQNLGGSTVGEHKKNFQNFKESLKSLRDDESSIDIILSSIRPRNLQEKLFYVRLLIEYKKCDQILKMLEIGDKIVSRKIIVNPEVVYFISRNFSAKDFVEIICPNLCSLNRNALIYKLGFQLEESDEYFEAIRKEYGQNIALNLLPTASEKLIQSTLDDNFICLNDRQLIFISRRFPNFLMFYFKQSGRRQFNSESKILLLHLLLNDHETLKHLVNSKVPRYGKRTAKRFIEICKEIVINEPAKFQDYYKTIHQVLNEKEFVQYFEKLLPTDIDDIIGWDVVFKNLVYIKLEKRAKFFFESFKKFYRQEYQESKICLGEFSQQNSMLLPLLPPDEREHFDLDFYLECLPIEKGIKKMKEKLDVTSEITSRQELMWNLVKICRANKSIEALLGVLEYVTLRIKNDNVKVREKFMDSLSYHFNLNVLNDDCWRWIEKMLWTFEVNSEPFYAKSDFLKVLISKKMQAKIDCKKEIVSYIKENFWNDYWTFTEKPEYEREIILLLPSLLATIPEVEKYNLYIQQFLKTIMYFNKKHPNHKISYFDYQEILEQLEDFQNTNDVLKSIFQFQPLDSIQEQAKCKFIEFCLQNINSEVNEDWVIWILWNKPELIEKNAEKLLKNLKGCTIFFYELSKMHYTVLPTLFENISRNLIKCTSKLEYLGPLEYMCCVKDYLTTVNTIKDSSHDPQGTDNYLPFQKMLLKSLHNSNDPCQIANVAFAYIDQDNPQDVLKPLYFSLLRIQQKNIQTFLRKFLNRSVSIRKHGIYLAINTGNLEIIINLINNMAETEKNISVQKYIFKSIFRAFRESAEEKLWLNFVKHLKSMLADTESVELLTADNVRIPKSFVPSYIEAIWNQLKTQKPYQKYRILKFISSENIFKIPSELSADILRSSLFNKYNFYQEDTETFVYNYLAFSQEDILTERIHIFYETIQTFLKDNVDNRDMIFNILISLCVQLVKKREECLAATKRLTNNLLKTIKQLPLECKGFEIFLNVFNEIITNPENIFNYIFNRQSYFENTYEFIKLYNEIIVLLIEFCCPRFQQTYESKLVNEKENWENCIINVKFQEILSNSLLKTENSFVTIFRTKYLSTN